LTKYRAREQNLEKIIYYANNFIYKNMSN
jgi:hypothetical protein